MNIPSSISSPPDPLGASPALRHIADRHPLLWKKCGTAAHLRRFARNAAVLHHGDSATTLWLVAKGWVKLTRQTPDGKETVVGLCAGGDIFGEAALFSHAVYPYHAEILEEGTELIAFPAESLRGAVREDPSFSAHLLSLLGERIAQTQLKLDQIHTMSATQRLGCFLLRLCREGREKERTLQIPVEKHVLAAYLGMKPETLSRSQQQLKSLGITVQNATVTIGDLDKLREFVCNSCSESGSCTTEASVR